MHQASTALLAASLRSRPWRRAAGTIATALACLLARGAYAVDAPRPVVVELYTSQGCSSCLPADALLGRLAERKDVLALSLPVTYWDMLGWKDTLATKANTDRQKAYAQVMGRGGVYTPQVIVDGLKDLVGSKEDAINAAIAAREADEPQIAVHLGFDSSEIHLAVEPAHDRQGDATIWLFAIRPAATVKIDGGENKGHTVTYHNVVTQVKAVGIWKGKRVTLDLPRSAGGAVAGEGLAVVIQKNGYSAILGATPILWLNGR